MSLSCSPNDPRVVSFPRVSGDEPTRYVPIIRMDLFSPRERG